MPAERCRTAGHALVRVLAGCCAVLLVACFEEPVEERLALCFLADGTPLVTVRTRVNDVPGAESNPALQRRLAEIRRAIEEGDDAWQRRFREMEPLVERRTFDLEGGELRELRRSAAGIEPEGLRRMFADGGVSALYARSDERAELSLVAGPSQRATEAQRKQVREALDRWTELLARYLADTGRLYAYLGERPQRAQACFSVLFAAVTRQRGEDLDERETALVATVTEDLDEAVKVFEVPDGEMYSVNELSHLVYDPFPARVEVRIAASPAEIEGFSRLADGALAVPGLGFWEAFEALEGRWVSPDPLLAYLHAQRDRPRTVDLTAFAALPRGAEAPPDAGTIRKEVERWLAPAPLYRVAWTPSAPTAGDDAPAFDWDAVRCP